MKLRKERPKFLSVNWFSAGSLTPQSTVPNRRLENEFHWESSQKIEKPLQLTTLAHIHQQWNLIPSNRTPPFMTFEGAFTKHKSEQ